MAMCSLLSSWSIRNTIKLETFFSSHENTSAGSILSCAKEKGYGASSLSSIRNSSRPLLLHRSNLAPRIGWLCVSILLPVCTRQANARSFNRVLCPVADFFTTRRISKDHPKPSRKLYYSFTKYTDLHQELPALVSPSKRMSRLVCTYPPSLWGLVCSHWLGVRVTFLGVLAAALPDHASW